MTDPAFRSERIDRGEGRVELRFEGRILLDDGPALRSALRSAGTDAAGVLVNLGDVSALDGGGAALLLHHRHTSSDAGVPVEIVGGRGDVAAILSLYDDRDARRCERAKPGRLGVIDQVGETAWDLASQVRGILTFVGHVTASTAGALVRPGSIHWADIGRLMERTGADGLPIVALISALIGLVTAFQMAPMLQQYGLELYVADLVGLSMFRYMGPLMTAILVTGRSGAGFAAELGTMKVSEEIDALRTLGLDPVRFLVVPRMIALLLMVPLLTIMADVIGVLGGLVVATLVLGLTPQSFFVQFRGGIDLVDVGTGLVNAVAFAFAIGMIACERGLSTRGGAEGVGRSTTSAVVTILFHLVVIASALTILFQAWDL